MIVKLRQGHPNRVMLARLADGAVVSVNEAGLEIEPGQVSDEMRTSGWFETAGKAEAVVQEPKKKEIQSGDADGAEGGNDQGNSPELPPVDPAPEVTPEKPLTPAQKAAATRAANKAARAQGK